MSDELLPANQNHSFRALMRNPRRECAEDALMAALMQMQEAGVDRATVIRTYFEYFLYTLGQTADGTGHPTDVEHAENIAIIEDVDTRWVRIRTQLQAAWPDLFAPHG